MADIYHAWGGGIKWTESGDLATVTNVELAVQRLVRKLLTNPAVRDNFGNVKQIGDYRFHQDYGKGLGRLVDSTNTDDNRVKRKNLILSALKEERIVDQHIAPEVNFYSVPNSDKEIIQVVFGTIYGSKASFGLQA